MTDSINPCNGPHYTLGQHFDEPPTARCPRCPPSEPATPPRALPPGVDDLLAWIGVECRCTQSFKCSPCKARKELRDHIATLTRDLAEARADALRWVLDGCGPRMAEMDLLHLEAELARLDAGEGVER